MDKQAGFRLQTTPGSNARAARTYIFRGSGLGQHRLARAGEQHAKLLSVPPFPAAFHAVCSDSLNAAVQGGEA
ncbi:MAG: hypothetical protein DMG42_34250 [Acidobacteria bacterium]|nr:MAG: hypothetical protein AUH13_19450 [Acidobacteria bacterium 13_2_20CM_58_27]PYT64625.1 MAG: hypothetical protein DMG42_34250 [Acidobacteriota bacterium]